MSADTHRRKRRTALALLLLLLFPALVLLTAHGGNPTTTPSKQPEPRATTGKSHPTSAQNPLSGPRRSADGDPLPEPITATPAIPLAPGDQPRPEAPGAIAALSPEAAIAPIAPSGNSLSGNAIPHGPGIDPGIASGPGITSGPNPPAGIDNPATANTTPTDPTPTATSAATVTHPAHSPAFLQSLAEHMIPALGGAQYGPSGPMGDPTPGAAAAGAAATPGMDHPSAPDGTTIIGGIPSGMSAPGRANPVAPATPGDRTVDWAFQYGPGLAYNQVTSTITITAAADTNGRAPASVSTFDDNGNLLVSYGATAFLDAQGNTHIDAQGSTVSGPMAGGWSPDSMAIDRYGYVHTLDDFNRSGNGWKN